MSAATLPSDLKRLLEKYDRPGPRYTSYPTAREFHATVGSREYSAALANLKAGERVAVYAHVPFCERRCTYCGCHVIPTRNRAIAEKYVWYLLKERVLLRRSLKATVRAESIHLGGGTPTFLGPAQLEELLDAIRSLFEPEPNAEIAVEIDPRVTTRKHLESLRSRGVNRLSLGVQDTAKEVQAAIGRDQSWESTARFHELARSLGFGSISVDLVYGLPFQTAERFDRTLRDVLALRPGRLAVFGYAHVPWMRSNQRAIDPLSLPGPSDRAELYLLAHDLIVAQGYLHIGLDHFALPGDALSVARSEGRLGRGFMGYTPWGDSKVIGVGVSAIGGLGSGYFQNEKNLSAYFDRIGAGDLPIERGFLLMKDDLLRRSVIQDILCSLRIDLDAFDAVAGVPFATYFAPEMKDLEELEADGLIRLTSASLEVLPLGRMFLRNIAMPFDRYLRRCPAAENTFSRTV